MNRRYKYLKNKGIPSGAMVMAVLGVFLLSGCFVNFSKYGGYKQSREVSRVFENLNLPPSYTYYYANTFSQPQALIGIEPGYTLDNDLWHRASPDQLKRLTDNMYVRAGYSPIFFGSYITSPDGKIVGIYYSRYKGGPVEMISGNKVNVNLPDTNIAPLATPAFG